MNITITGRHVDITDAMKEHARACAEKLLKYFDHLTSIQVVMNIEGDLHKAEIIASAPTHATIVAKAEEINDMYAALDEAARRAERQLLKFKEKLQDKHRAAASRQHSKEEALSETAEVEEEVEEGVE